VAAITVSALLTERRHGAAVRTAFFSIGKISAGAAVLAAALACGGAGGMPGDRPTPSGQPVPRWISLKSDRVFARRGPDREHRILWLYRARGLPVQVVAETRDWRLICDPEGATAWVHRSVLSGRRTLFNPAAVELPIHAGRSDGSGLKARLKGRAVVDVKACEDGWCRVRFGRQSGWVRADRVFGSADRALCDADRPAGPRSRNGARRVG
jgi:SH3-like domain-containing protein